MRGWGLVRHSALPFGWVGRRCIVVQTRLSLHSSQPAQRDSCCVSSSISASSTRAGKLTHDKKHAFQRRKACTLSVDSNGHIWRTSWRPERQRGCTILLPLIFFQNYRAAGSSIAFFPEEKPPEGKHLPVPHLAHLGKTKLERVYLSPNLIVLVGTTTMRNSLNKLSLRAHASGLLRRLAASGHSPFKREKGVKLFIGHSTSGVWRHSRCYFSVPSSVYRFFTDS